jgi:hypothetical protein
MGTAALFGWGLLAGFAIATFSAVRYWWRKRRR